MISSDIPQPLYRRKSWMSPFNPATPFGSRSPKVIRLDPCEVLAVKAFTFFPLTQQLDFFAPAGTSQWIDMQHHLVNSVAFAFVCQSFPPTSIFWFAVPEMIRLLLFCGLKATNLSQPPLSCPKRPFLKCWLEPLCVVNRKRMKTWTMSFAAPPFPPPGFKSMFESILFDPSKVKKNLFAFFVVESFGWSEVNFEDVIKTTVSWTIFVAQLVN